MTSDFDVGIRRRLFLAREAARYTIKDAANAIGMTRQKLSRVENGSSPSLEELKALCILYGVTPGYILLGDNIQPAIDQAMRAVRGIAAES